MSELTCDVVLSCGAAVVCASVCCVFFAQGTLCAVVSDSRRTCDGTLPTHTRTQGKEVGEEVDSKKKTRLHHVRA